MLESQKRKQGMLTIDGLVGLWLRQGLDTPGHHDVSTRVFWLQGVNFFCDLRQPNGRPARQARCLRELRREMLLWMAKQEGNAGFLELKKNIVTWNRLIDMQPSTGWSHRGALSFQAGVMVEQGVGQTYVENWVRGPGRVSPAGVLEMVDTETRARGFLIRVGDNFMYARGRAGKLPGAECVPKCCLPAAWCWCCRLLPLPGFVTIKFLPDLVDLMHRAPSLEAAQDLFDCEYSFGNVLAGFRWGIKSSSLPFREGADLCPTFELDLQTKEARKMSMADIDIWGAKITRNWMVVRSAGDSVCWTPLPV